MTSELPDIAGLEALPLDIWTQLRERFQQAGFSTEYPIALRRPAIGSYAETLQRPIVLWHLRRRRDVPASAFRIFALGDPVTIQEGSEVFGWRLMEELLDAGLLFRPEPNSVVSPFVLRVFRDLLILCDDLAHRGHAVFGTGYGTAAFCNLSSRRGLVRNALDVGCGGGAVALWHAARAERVVATDINPRALAFVKINAALNHISNVDIREGDLFEPVAGEKFDFITSQPPYVPDAPGLRQATYLYGGPNGNELVSRVVSELPDYLSRDGHAMVVFEQPVRAGADECEHDADSVANDTHTLFVIGEEVPADVYSLRHAAPELRRDMESFDKAAMDMREHLNNVGIRGLCPAICVMQKVEDSASWTETLRAGDNLWNEVSTEMIERLLAGQALLRQPDDGLRRASVRIPEGTLIVRPFTAAQTNDKVYLGLPPGYLLSSLELSQGEWEAFESSNEGKSMELTTNALLVKAARAGLIDE